MNTCGRAELAPTNGYDRPAIVGALSERPFFMGVLLGGGRAMRVPTPYFPPR